MMCVELHAPTRIPSQTQCGGNSVKQWRRQQFDYYISIKSTSINFTNYQKCIFCFVFALVFLVQYVWGVHERSPHSAHYCATFHNFTMSTSVEWCRTLKTNDSPKKRCKSRYCTDFVTWILKRQIFYVTKIFGASLGTILPAARIDNAPTNAFLCAGFSGTLGSRMRYGIYVLIEFMYSASAQWVAQHFLLGDSWLALHTEHTPAEFIIETFEHW